jgi:urea carboxylase-associated protein 1
MIVESTRTSASAYRIDRVDSGDYYLERIPKGHVVRLLDLEGNQAADTLFFDAVNPTERYSVTDTIREQGNVYLAAGSVLRSTANKPLLTIVADTCGRHDTLGGACASESNTVRYDLEKRCMHSCRDSWMLAIAEKSEYGLTKADIGHNINFFMNVPITAEGGLTFEDGISAPGKYVELRADCDVLMLISNCPQLNNPCNGYNPTPIDVLMWEE